MQYYWSDTHFGHANILQYCQRPWTDIVVHDCALFSAWLSVQDTGATVYHLGDVWFRPRVDASPWKDYIAALRPEQNVMVFGNHDQKTRTFYRRVFSEQHGSAKDRARESMCWIDDVLDGQPVRLLLSHHPQPVERFDGAQYNLHGHIHNGFDTHGDMMRQAYPWLIDSPVHLNCAVERVGYRPRSLPELLALRCQYTA